MLQDIKTLPGRGLDQRFACQTVSSNGLSRDLKFPLNHLSMLCRETKSLKLAKLRGCTFVNQYVVIKYLGRGACGRVFLCMDMNDNRLYAVKVKLCRIVSQAENNLCRPRK